jgi:hypothetical protein
LAQDWFLRYCGHKATSSEEIASGRQEMGISGEKVAVVIVAGYAVPFVGKPTFG